MKEKEFIKHVPGDHDAWMCLCGNMPAQNGFFPCDKTGKEIEPDIDSNWENLYVCAQCGRTINMDSLEVVGQTKEFRLYRQKVMSN